MRTPPTSQAVLPEDPFAATGYSDYPACRMARGRDEAGFAFSAAERDRIARLKSDGLQRDLRGSLIVRRELIARMAGCDPGEVSLTATAEGAPELRRPEGWTVSLAHTRDVTVVALGRAPMEIGVDIETVRELNWAPMLSMLCSEEDRIDLERTLGTHPNSLRAFFRMWTLKEAVLKSTKRGFRAGPKAVSTPFEILVAPSDGELTAFGGAYRFWSVDLDDLVVSLAERLS